ncbi:MAG: glycoside hydrolase family 15 protein [Acidimicrobiales bacterium]
MACRIEDYAFLSDLESGALVGRDGSIDWLTFPRFDSSACFAALLGNPEHGRWLLAPTAEPRSTKRRYRDGSLVLETVYTTDEGEVAVIDCMPPRDEHLQVVRLVEGRRGRVAMRMELVIRFDNGSIVPWVRNVDGDLLAIGGPDSLRLSTPVEVTGADMTSVAAFSVGPGDVVPFMLSWFPSHQTMRPVRDAEELVRHSERWWADWSSQGTYRGRWSDEVCGSLTVLKGLTYAPTGGIVAAATTSLPEQIGGERNWDYRFCWLRDATFSLIALLAAGYTEEASAWRDWLLRAVAGDPADLQIMYGLAGERRLAESELSWLPGYEGSFPVRAGNAAHEQFQLDVYGEILDALHHAELAGIDGSRAAWELQAHLLDFLEGAWQMPDEGIWEVRGPRQQFTHSKVMAWVAFDRAVRTAELTGFEAPVARWREKRDEVRRWVLDNGVDDRGVFVQRAGSSDLDASLLMVPLVGFLPATDERVVRTIEAIERELTVDGFVRRYDTKELVDGLPPGEGAFLLCTFWLADAQASIGRADDAVATFERLLALRNDVGLLAEQVDPATGRFLGNVPQAFSHTALINTAMLLDGTGLRRT